MKRLLFLLLLFLASSARAQLSPASSSSGSITTNASSCATTNACVTLHMATSNVGYSVTASGTWTGTLTVEQSGDNQGSWTSATTTTSNTLYTSALTPGITDVRVRGSAAMTGTAVVTITASGPAVLQQITQTGAGGVTPNSPIPANQAQGPRFNVVNYGTGIINDAQHITDGVTAGGAAKTVSSATAQFTAADVGKKIVCTFPNNNPLAAIQGTILVRNSATLVTTDTNDNGASGGLRCIWYTKDATSAFQAANTAALPSITSKDPNIGPQTLGTPPGTVYCPEGGYAVSGRIFQFTGAGSNIGPAFVGAGKNKCLIYVVPGTVDPGDGFPVLMSFYNGIDATFKDFSVDGLGFGFAFTHPIIGTPNAQQITFDNVKVTNISITSGSAGTVDFNAAANGETTNLFVQGTGNTGNGFACSFTGGTSGILNRNIFCSNQFQSLLVTATNVRTVGGDNGVVFIGGAMDECGSTTVNCTIISSNGLINAYATTFMTGFANRSAIDIDATSVGLFSNISCGQFGSTTVVSNCMTIASGGKASVNNSDLRGNGTGANGVSVTGPAGAIFVDEGGNTFRNCVSGVCTAITAATYATQGFTGGIVPKATVTHTPNTCHLTITPIVNATTYPLCNSLLDQNYQIINISASSFATTTCATAPIITISDGVQTATLTLTTAKNSWKTGVDASSGLNSVFATGNTMTVKYDVAALSACATPATNLSISYVLQSVLNP